MIRVSLRNIPTGAKLARNIYSLDGRLLLSRGTLFTEQQVTKLNHLGIEEVYIILEDSPQVEKPPADGVREKLPSSLVNVYNMAVDSVKDLMNRVSSGRQVTTEEFEETMEIFMPEVLETRNVLRYLHALRIKDVYTEQHSVAVAILAIKIGQVFKYSNQNLRNLGLAGLLHDVGKCKIPKEILNKPGTLNIDEIEIMKLHPLYGLKILNDMEIDSYAVQSAVGQHHERNDGTGYPQRLTGNNISIFARIVAVADVFDALTTDRVYRPRVPLFKAMDEITRQTFGHLDPLAARNLMKYIIDLSPGETVVLSTGERGKIVMVNPEEPNRPLVKVGDRFIDLREKRNIFIAELLFNQPIDVS